MDNYEILLDKIGFNYNNDIVRRKAPNYMYQGYKVINWDNYKLYWTYIQKLIDNTTNIGRICPECGIILKHHLKPHLELCGWDEYRWIYEFTDKSIRDCPVCGKPRIHHLGYTLLKTCGNKECKDVLFHDYRSKAGKLGFIALSKSVGCTLKDSYGFKSNLIIDNRSLLMRSLCELWTILYFLLVDHVSPSNISMEKYYINNTKEFDSIGAFSDIRVINDDGSFTNYEIHDINDTININRKKYCTELNGDKFVLVSLQLSDDHYNKLLKLGYNVDKIKLELIDSRKINIIPNIDFNKIVN